VVTLDDGGRGPGHEAEDGDEEEHGVCVQLAEEAEITVHIFFLLRNTFWAHF